MTTNITTFTGEGLDDTALQAPADWSGSDTHGPFQFRGVDLDAASADPANPAAKLPSAGDAIIGVVQNAPTSGEKCLIRFMGVTKAIAGGAVSLGDQLAVDANGCFVTATTGKAVVGIALMPANAAKDYFTILLFPVQLGTHA